MEETSKLILKTLKEAGIAAYFPAEHEGICTYPYCVIQPMGAYRCGSRRTGREHIRLHFLIPLEDYSEMERLILSAREALAPLFSSGRVRSDEMSASLIDESFKAHCRHMDCVVLFD